MKPLNSAARTAFFTALAAVSLTASLPAQTAAASDLDALREQIRQLDQKLRVLERNTELKDEAAVAAAKKQPKLTVGDGRIEVASADGANSLRLRGLVQADARFYLDKANAAQDGFVLRRARLIFEGKFNDNFQYTVQPEFAGSTVSILDANVNVGLTPEFNVLIGRFKTPVGLEQLQSDPVAFFNERSIATNLAPNRDAGIQLHGLLADKRLSYQASITNGVIDGGNSPASSVNDEGDFTLAGRLFATPFVNDKDSALKGLGFGLAGATGNYQGSASSTLLNSYRTDGQQTFYAYRTVSSGATAANTTVAAGNSYVVSPQAYYYNGPVGLLAEYFFTGSDVSIGSGSSKNAQTLNNKAYNLSAGYVLTGEDAGFKGVTPATNFNLAAGTWGAFELVARFAQLDIDDNAFTDPAGAPITLADKNKSASGVTSYGLGLNWYLSKTVRAGFNIFENKFDLAPGASPSANTVLADNHETAFITRLQVSF